MLSLLGRRPRWIGVLTVCAPVLVAMTYNDGSAIAQPAAPQPAPTTDAKKPPAKPLTEAQKKANAKKAFDEAGKKFDAGEFVAAYELFREADELVPGAVPKFRMAEALDKQGDVVGAVKAYEAFLASNPDATKKGMPERIDAAKARIEALKKTPAEVKVTVTPATAKLFVDGVEQQSNPVKIPPGKHVLSAQAEGFDEAKQDIEVAFAEKREAALTLPAKAAPPPEPAKPAPTTAPAPTDPPKPPPESSGTSSTVPAIITLSLAGVGAVVGTVFGVLALGSKSDFEDTPTQDLFDETERNALIADMSFGVAITFGVTGLVLLLSGGDDEPAPATAAAGKPQFTPWAGPQGGGGAVTVKF